MLVASIFKGDEDMEVAWLQHGVYYEAWDLIQRKCQALARFAHSYSGGDPEECEYVTEFDHRTLQHAHDIIAAVWRSERLPSVKQLKMHTGGHNATDPDFVGDWLNWLESEVESWIESPTLVRLVIQILRNQNTHVGYKAERELERTLFWRFSNVPWRPNLIDKAKADE